MLLAPTIPVRSGFPPVYSDDQRGRRVPNYNLPYRQSDIRVVTGNSAALLDFSAQRRRGPRATFRLSGQYLWQPHKQRRGIREGFTVLHRTLPDAPRDYGILRRPTVTLNS